MTLSVDAAVGGNLADRVYRELREAICDARLGAHERLVQNALADQLGISRTPVRDALLRLAQEGLVKALPWRGGYAVSEFTSEEVLHIYDVRLGLEPLALRQAVGRHTRAQIAHLRDLDALIADEPQSSVAEHYQLNQQLHAGLVEPCDNDLLKRMLEQLWSMPSALRMYHHQVAGGHGVDPAGLQHDAIIDAVEAGDGDTAEARLREHLETARRGALAHFERQAS